MNKLIQCCQRRAFFRWLRAPSGSADRLPTKRFAAGTGRKSYGLTVQPQPSYTDALVPGVGVCGDGAFIGRLRLPEVIRMPLWSVRLASLDEETPESSPSPLRGNREGRCPQGEGGPVRRQLASPLTLGSPDSRAVRKHVSVFMQPRVLLCGTAPED